MLSCTAWVEERPSRLIIDISEIMTNVELNIIKHLQFNLGHNLLIKLIKHKLFH